MKYLTLATIALASGTLLGQPIQAEIIVYDIKDGGAEGLSGFTVGGGAPIPDPYWSFEPGSTFTVDTNAGTGSISAQVINNLGVLTPLELEFSGLLDTLDGTDFYYVQGQGAPYNPATQDYFTRASGTFDYAPLGEPFRVDADDPLTGNSVVQFGEGANYRDPEEFGLAAWLRFINPVTGDTYDNWDINVALHRQPTPVPEPAPLALLGLGLAGIAFTRRRRRKRESPLPS